jgi:hypothetical protein
VRLTARRGAPLVLSLTLLNLGFVSAVVATARPGGPAGVGPVAQATASPTATAASTLPPATEIPLPTPVIGTSGGAPTPIATPRASPSSRAPSTDTEP